MCGIATGELYNVDDDPYQFDNLWDDPHGGPSATTWWRTSTPACPEERRFLKVVAPA